MDLDTKLLEKNTCHAERSDASAVSLKTDKKADPPVSGV
jgi:hypothetical protein